VTAADEDRLTPLRPTRRDGDADRIARTVAVEVPAEKWRAMNAALAGAAAAFPRFAAPGDDY
jgi:hypothetical protein